MNPDRFDIGSILRLARIPGCAFAVCARGEIAVAAGYGLSDLQSAHPMTAQSVFPIGSTTKAMTATLVGTLVNEGLLQWDCPIQSYLPEFRLQDSDATASATLRDILAMRTGMPRHDWTWDGDELTFETLLSRLPHLALSSQNRQRFQYNSLLITLAGHICRLVTGDTWEALIQNRILDPLEMKDTTFGAPASSATVTSYHENGARELVRTRHLSSDGMGPAGGSIYSTIQDMARWALCNLRTESAGSSVLAPETLREIHTPCISVGADLAAPTRDSAYALCWFVDSYRGHRRISHGGYLHDVSTDVSIFPEEGLALLAFTNFGCPFPARLITQHIFDTLLGRQHPDASIQESLAAYERKVVARCARVPQSDLSAQAQPSHSRAAYIGTYGNPGYGVVEVIADADDLILRRSVRDGLWVPLRHWRQNSWVLRENDLFNVHQSSPFDAESPLEFELSRRGRIASLRIQLEPATTPIRFFRL